LYDNPAVDQAFEIDEGFADKFMQALDIGDPDDSEVFLFGKNIHDSGFKIGGHHHLAYCLETASAVALSTGRLTAMHPPKAATRSAI
jgi:hypothetical protein